MREGFALCIVDPQGMLHPHEILQGMRLTGASYVLVVSSNYFSMMDLRVLDEQLQLMGGDQQVVIARVHPFLHEPTWDNVLRALSPLHVSRLLPAASPGGYQIQSNMKAELLIQLDLFPKQGVLESTDSSEV